MDQESQAVANRQKPRQLRETEETVQQNMNRSDGDTPRAASPSSTAPEPHQDTELTSSIVRPGAYAVFPSHPGAGRSGLRGSEYDSTANLRSSSVNLHVAIDTFVVHDEQDNDPEAVKGEINAAPIVIATRDDLGTNLKNRRCLKIVGCVAATLVIFALAVGLGVSLSMGNPESQRDGIGGDGSANMTTPAAPSVVPTASTSPTSFPTASPTSLAWEQLGSDINGLATHNFFGDAVSFSDDGMRLAIGTSPIVSDDEIIRVGYARVYVLREGSWAVLGTDLVGDEIGDWFGTSIEISGDGRRVAVGAPFYDMSSGLVKVFELQSDSWEVVGGTIPGVSLGERSGWEVSLSRDGSIVAIAAPFSGVGRVRVYHLRGGNWTQMGSDIEGGAEANRFGFDLSLSADGHIVAIGAPGDGIRGERGHARVFFYESGSWQQMGQDLDGEVAGDFSGSSVSLSDNGTIVAIGSPCKFCHDNHSGNVHIHQYVWSENEWVQLGEHMEGAAGEWFGESVSLSTDGFSVAVGAPNNNGKNGEQSGQTQVFTYNGSSWQQLGGDIDGERLGGDVDGESAGESSGWSVSLSADGHRVAIGAPFNQVNGAESGRVRIFELRPV